MNQKYMYPNVKIIVLYVHGFVYII